LKLMITYDAYGALDSFSNPFITWMFALTCTLKTYALEHKQTNGQTNKPSKPANQEKTNQQTNNQTKQRTNKQILCRLQKVTCPNWCMRTVEDSICKVFRQQFRCGMDICARCAKICNRYCI
jgi:hypothetical protein